MTVGAPLNGSRLILIEGPPGSGKSTTAQWLCRLHEAEGHEAEWHHEQDVHHPVYRDDELQAATRAGRAACEAYHAAARDRWRALATRAASGSRIAIVESSFLQSPIASMMLARCRPGALSRHVEETASILAPLDPRLIVLRHDDPADAYEHARASRGPQFEPFLIELVRATPYGEVEHAATAEGVRALLRDHAAALEEHARHARMQRIEVNVSRRAWGESRRIIAEFLGLPMHDPYASGHARNGFSFTGRYRDAGTSQELVVRADDRGLFLEATGTRLLARGDRTFELEGLPIELTFEGRGRAAERMRCRSQLSEIGPVWERIA